jgi:hypothetical protein
MKALGEVIHEVMGHGFFVLLFGGDIVRVHIALLWPYEFSYISSNGPFAAWQRTWIHGGGILVCYIVSFALLALLLLKNVREWRLSASLFWLAFWTFLSSTGYLITGGLRPYGDVAALIADGVLTAETSLLLGLFISIAGFFALSKILMDLLMEIPVIRSIRELRIALALFWLLIPVITTVYCLGRRLPLGYLQLFTTLSAIPVLVAIVTPNLLRCDVS